MSWEYTSSNKLENLVYVLQFIKKHASCSQRAISMFFYESLDQKSLEILCVS